MPVIGKVVMKRKKRDVITRPDGIHGPREWGINTNKKLDKRIAGRDKKICVEEYQKAQSLQFDKQDTINEREDEISFQSSLSRGTKLATTVQNMSYSTVEGTVLRSLYKDGDLRRTSTRINLLNIRDCVATQQVPTFRTATHLLGCGVGSFPFNLFTAAHLSLGFPSPTNFSKKNNSGNGW
mmetsp:Transcript_21442/g.27729  ORF Transcript_21442/g.27729 Transcript_21442/m.27729 type:complete len:181 (+) Transcript_21442:542-1084(+)